MQRPTSLLSLSVERSKDQYPHGSNTERAPMTRNALYSHQPGQLPYAPLLGTAFFWKKQHQKRQQHHKKNCIIITTHHYSSLVTTHHISSHLITTFQSVCCRSTESGGTCTKALSVFRKALASPSKVQTWELTCWSKVPWFHDFGDLRKIEQTSTGRLATILQSKHNGKS